MEFFEGFGIKELVKAAVATLVCGTAGIIFHALGAVSLTALIVLILASAGGGVIFTVKDRNNLSVYDQIILMARFSRSSKKYPYIYMEEWS
jgi:hypothetical protein